VRRPLVLASGTSFPSANTGPELASNQGCRDRNGERASTKREKKSDFSESSWSEFLKEADRDNELIAGKAGRRQSLDENIKVERELKALTTKGP